jgi:hypothetical protein
MMTLPVAPGSLGVMVLVAGPVREGKSPVVVTVTYGTEEVGTSSAPGGDVGTWMTTMPGWPGSVGG